MFSFTVKYLGFLKDVPLLPHLLDTMLRTWTLLTAPAIQDCIDDLETEVRRWSDTTIGLHKYGGLQFNHCGKEFGHVHGNGILDILFSRKLKQQLLAEGRINDHHVFKNSGWISFYIRNRDDGLYAKELLKMAYSHKN